MVARSTDASPDPGRLRGSFALVDLETTGGNTAHHRVIEIGVVLYDDGHVVEEWSTLVNPQTRIPAGIERFTGITNAMVADAPVFAAIADDVRERLDGRVLVAHNARFDHGFLRMEFRRLGQRLSVPVLCTVRLSRSLFPQFASHSLDALIERHGFACSARHRALGDARVLADFLDHVAARHGESNVRAAIDKLSAGPRLPPQLSADLADDLPEAPGVYRFHGDDGTLLYIGKSRNIRARVLQHFAAAERTSADRALSRLVSRVDWIETAGELGALLLEAQLVKTLRPTHNRRLRDCEGWWTIRLDARGRPIAEELAGGQFDASFGLYRARADARRMIERVVRDSGLCLKVLGLEPGPGSCFAYQLGRCRGACVGAEPIAVHEARLRLAFASMRLRTWPFAGVIGIRERGLIGEQVHVFDDWRHLGTAASDDELESIVTDSRGAQLDADVYRILTRALARGTGTVVDIPIGRKF